MCPLERAKIDSLWASVERSSSVSRTAHRSPVKRRFRIIGPPATRRDLSPRCSRRTHATLHPVLLGRRQRRKRSPPPSRRPRQRARPRRPRPLWRGPSSGSARRRGRTGTPARYLVGRSRRPCRSGSAGRLLHPPTSPVESLPSILSVLKRSTASLPQPIPASAIPPSAPSLVSLAATLQHAALPRTKAVG